MEGYQMTVATKIVKKLALQIQVGDDFEDDAMQLVPVLDGRIKQTPNLIEDESFAGNAFSDVPQRGTISVEGSIDFQVDQLSIRPILEATMGHVESLVPGKRYIINDHAKKLSVCIFDGIKNNRYSNIYVKSLQISGSAEAKFTGTIEVIGMSAEDRADIATFPTAAPYGEFMHFHEMQGEGYFRVNTIESALTADDDICIEDFEVTINTGFEEQFANCSTYTLKPIFGMTAPSVEGNFKVARYTNDKFLEWLETLDRLQVEFRIQKSPTAVILGQIPMFILDTELTDDDITGQNITMTIGRNGIGAYYKNGNMEFNSPIRITVIDE